MRKKILVILSVMFVFGLFGGVYALSRTVVNAEKTAASSCPMKKQTSASAEKGDSCCGLADCCKDDKCSMGGSCCKDKDSCPMKQQSKDTSSTMGMDMSKVAVAVSDENCCQPGADCCKGGACCHKKS